MGLKPRGVFKGEAICDYDGGGGRRRMEGKEGKGRKEGECECAVTGDFPFLFPPTHLLRFRSFWVRIRAVRK